ncbi:MAG TPA: ABC transporter substrate-binding protein [Chthonomonadales bacterium]|nr:ABC transporter substrate-binding protein [Chthonomonadales bacterium]
MPLRPAHVALVVALAAVIVVAGCRQRSVAPSDEILVGHFTPLTGTTSTFGISTHRGVQLAIDEVNAAGGVNGKRIRLVTEDTASKPDVARTVVTKLVTQDRVVAVLGEVASTRSLAAAPVCQSHQVPMISPASTNVEVTRKGDYIFRVCFTDDFQGAVQAHFAWDQGWRRAAIFRDIKNDYSVALADSFAATFRRLGGEIVGEQSYQEGDADFKAQLNSLKALRPDVLLVPGYYSEVGTIARHARQIGLTAPLLGGDGWDSPTLVAGAGGPGGALEGSAFTNHHFSTELDSPHVQAFINSFTTRYGSKPDSLAALGYDAAKLLASAMQRAKALDGPSLRDAIAQTRDFPGVTGMITIDANRNARKDALILQVVGERFTVKRAYSPEQIGL